MEANEGDSHNKVGLRGRTIKVIPQVRFHLSNP